MRKVAALGAWLLLSACAAETRSPEAEIRALVAAAEASAREHDLAALRPLIAPDYADPAGRDKSELEAILAYHFLRNPRIHLLVRIRSLDLVGDDRAEVEALVATAGTPIEALAQLAEVRADLLWIDLALARAAPGWRVTRARWRRAALEDLLP